MSAMEDDVRHTRIVFQLFYGDLSLYFLSVCLTPGGHFGYSPSDLLQTET